VPRTGFFKSCPTIPYTLGEAFFDVPGNRHDPSASEPEVLVEEIGTLFNVRNYAEEKICCTIVTEGAVKVIDGDNQVVLHEEDFNTVLRDLSKAHMPIGGSREGEKKT